MTSQYDLDAFANSFDDEVNAAHARDERTSAPSIHVWNRIQAQAKQAETADPRAIGPDHGVVQSTTKRNRTMDAALSPRVGGYTRTQPHQIGWVAVLAAGLVGIMIITSVWLNGANVPPDDGTDLAWAPGMGSPESSPSSIIATPGPEYACSALPLTTSEVMSILRNPAAAYEQRGHDFSYDPPLSELREDIPAPNSNWETVTLTASADVALNGQLEEFGNTFWNCLMTGTAYQVWGMMDPTLLQWSILRSFPVLRSEDELQQYVELWGPQAYGSSGMDIYPILIGVPPQQAARVVDSGYGSIRVSTPRDLEGMQTRIGIITMVPASGENDLNYYELYVSEHPDGSWSINGIGINPNMPRG